MVRFFERTNRFAVAACAFAAAFSIACSGSSSGGTTTNDASSDSSAETGSCRTNVDHRASAEVCASHADAGPMETGCGGAFTPHDDCTKDDDCNGAHGASGVCACQSPHGMGCGAGVVSGNACVPSSCRTDSDCSPCHTCRVEQSCGLITGYYCGTPLDECSSNADCGTGFCTFKGDRWKCLTNVACAG